MWEIIEETRQAGQSNSDLLRVALMDAGRRLYSDMTDWAIQCRLAIPRLNAEYEFQSAHQRVRRVERSVAGSDHPRAQARMAIATRGLSDAWQDLLALDGEGQDVYASDEPWVRTPAPAAPQRAVHRLHIPESVSRARESVRRTTHLTRREDGLIAHVCASLATTPDAIIDYRIHGVPPLRDERPVGTRLAMAQQAVALGLRGGIPPIADACDVCGSVTPL